MSMDEGTFNWITLITTLITGVVVAVLWITTKFGRGEVKGAIAQQSIKSVLEEVDRDRSEFKESMKDLKIEVRRLSDKVNEVTTTLTVESHITNETKILINELNKRIFDLERKIFELDRRTSNGNGRSPVR